MKIQTRIILMLAVVITVFGMAFFLSEYFERQKTVMFYRDKASEKQRSFDTLKKLYEEIPATFAYDYSYWDDMVKFVSTGDKNWGHENIKMVLKTYRADAAWVLRKDCSVVYATSLTTDSGLREFPIAAGVLKRILARKSFNHFYVQSKKGLLELNTAPIQPSIDNERKTKPLGYFIVGQLWTDRHIKEISSMIDCSVRLVPPGSPLLAATDDIPIRFSREMKGWDGKTIMVMDVRSSPPIIGDLGESSSKQLFMVIIFSLVIVLLLFASLRQWVWLPLNIITRSLDSEDLWPLEILARQNTEMGRIARVVEKFFIQKYKLNKEMRERVKSDESLRILEKALNTSQLGITISDPKGMIIHTNPADARMHGFTQEELAYREANIFAPENRRVRMTPERMMDMHSFKRECLNVRKDGSQFDASLISDVVRDADGQPVAMVTICEDITERKQAERERARLVEAVESTADAVIIADKHGVIEYVNPAFVRITGYSRDEVVGQIIEMLNSWKQYEATYHEIWGTLKNMGSWSGNLTGQRKDGSTYEEEATISPVRSQGGEVIGFIAVKRDVSEKRRLRSIAEAVNTMKTTGYIFSGIRHEVGNPVNSAKMTLHLLKCKLGELPPETVAEYVDRSLSALVRVEYILNSLKNFNMYEKLDIKDVPVGSFIDKFLPLVTNDFATKGIKITTDIMPESLVVRADPRALQQVLLNIFVNAADALAGVTDALISLNVSAEAGFVKFDVADNGCGMTEEQHNELFKPFYTFKAGGTGLGLVITRNMLSKMGGEIDIVSSPGKGTVVRINIPEADADA